MRIGLPLPFAARRQAADLCTLRVEKEAAQIGARLLCYYTLGSEVGIPKCRSRPRSEQHGAHADVPNYHVSEAATNAGIYAQTVSVGNKADETSFANRSTKARTLYLQLIDPHIVATMRKGGINTSGNSGGSRVHANEYK